MRCSGNWQDAERMHAEMVRQQHKLPNQGKTMDYENEQPASNQTRRNDYRPSGPRRGYQGGKSPAEYAPRTYVEDKILGEQLLEIEQKSFKVTLRENRVGQFLKISEHRGHQKNSIIVPASGVTDLLKAICHVMPQAPVTPLAEQ